MSNRSAEAVCCQARVCGRATAEATLCAALVCAAQDASKAWVQTRMMSKYRCLVFAAGRGRARSGGAQPNAQRMPREAQLRPGAHRAKHASSCRHVTGEEPAADGTAFKFQNTKPKPRWHGYAASVRSSAQIMPAVSKCIHILRPMHNS